VYAVTNKTAVLGNTLKGLYMGKLIGLYGALTVTTECGMNGCAF
jgi:hypothetical protein